MGLKIIMNLFGEKDDTAVRGGPAGRIQKCRKSKPAIETLDFLLENVKKFQAARVSFLNFMIS